jgi:hypothetical protein
MGGAWARMGGAREGTRAGAAGGQAWARMGVHKAGGQAWARMHLDARVWVLLARAQLRRGLPTLQVVCSLAAAWSQGSAAWLPW